MKTEKVSEPTNPYVKRALDRVIPPKQKVENVIDTDDLGEFGELSNFDKEKALLSNSLIEGNNKYLFASIIALRRELKEVKEDLTSLYLMITEPEDIDKLTKEEIGDKYLNFKNDIRHLLNRKQ